MRPFISCGDEVVTLTSKWTIGAAGAHSKATNCNGTGFTSVARTAAGEYTITFARGVPFGKLVELRVVPWGAATPTTPLVAKPIRSSFTAETASAQATVKYETWDVAIPTKTELAIGDEVSITAVFQKTK